MNEVFGAIYAHAYDALYADKDYAAECDLIEHLLKRYGDSPVRSLLDLGCGTGNHAIPLARRGYEVVGVDQSADMLALAQSKAAGLEGGGSLSFQQGNIRRLDLHRHFDAALMMFAVLGYQLKNGDVLAALKAARQHLQPGKLFIFDVWYGPAVLHVRPSQRIKVIPTSGGKVLRAVSGELDVRRHLCAVTYHVWRLEHERVMEETEERHRMRYFFPLELELLLESTGFTPLRLGAFPEYDREPDETTWNVMGVARAV